MELEFEDEMEPVTALPPPPKVLNGTATTLKTYHDTDETDLPPIETPQLPTVTPVVSYGIPETLFNQTPDCLVREVAEYILSVAPCPSPTAALATALTTVATIKSHAFVLASNTPVTPNIYAVIVGEAGSGKTTTAIKAQEVLNACNDQASYISNVTGGASLQDALCDNPRRLLLIDEWGRKFGFKRSSRDKNDSDFVTQVMELYGQELTNYPVRRFAKDKNAKKSVDPQYLHMPHLSVLGTTTTDLFFAEDFSDRVSEGFISRHLVFFMEKKDTSESTLIDRYNSRFSNKGHRPLISTALSHKLAGISITAKAIRTRLEENKTVPIPTTETIQFFPYYPTLPSPEAQEFLAITVNLYVHRKTLNSTAQIQDLYARFMLQVEKVAIICNDSITLSLETVKFAFNLVKHSFDNLEALIIISQHARSEKAILPFQLLWDKVLSLMSVDRDCAKSELTRRIRVSNKLLNEILVEMAQAEIIQVFSRPSAGRYITAYRLKPIT